MLAAPPISTTSERSDGLTKRVIAAKHLKRASRSGWLMGVLVGMFRRYEAETVLRSLPFGVSTVSLAVTLSVVLRESSGYLPGSKVWGGMGSVLLAMSAFSMSSRMPGCHYKPHLVLRCKNIDIKNGLNNDAAADAKKKRGGGGRAGKIKFWCLLYPWRRQYSFYISCRPQLRKVTSKRVRARKVSFSGSMSSQADCSFASYP